MSRIARDAVFSALADENRRALLDRLRKRNGQTLAELCTGQPITRQAVTKHLRILEEANLVLSARHGREKLHYLNPVPIHAVAMRWLKQFDAIALGSLRELKTQEHRQPRQVSHRSGTGRMVKA